MTEEEKGQAKEQPGLDELFAKGWDKLEEENTPKPEPKQEPEKKEDEECPDCPDKKTKEEGAEEKKAPYKVIKHMGKEIPIESEEELVSLAQKGFDYTFKRQQDSDTQKKWEEDFKAERAKLDDLVKKYEELTRQGKPAPDAKPPQPQEVDKEALYKDFGIDEEYASDFEKRAVDRMVSLENQNKQLQQVSQLMVLNEVYRKVDAAIRTAREEFPIEEITDDSGKSQTAEQVITILKNKLQDPGNQNKPIFDLARDTIKEVHDYQSKQKELAQPFKEEEMSPEEFKEKFPKMYEKLTGAPKPADKSAEAKKEEELPPTLDDRKREPVPSKEEPKKGDGKFKDVGSAIDAGFDQFSDEDLQQIFRGG